MYLSSSITVIIPTYNRAGIISKAIISALEQSIPPIEVLVVDDGSSDQTVSIVQAFPDQRVRCIAMGINRGAQFARIIGIKEAQGDYIVFLDSDDELLPFSFERRLQALRDSGWPAALVYGDVIRSGKLVAFERCKGNVYPYLLKELSLCTYSVMMIPISCFAVAGLPDHDFPSWQDDDMVLTIGKHFPVLHCGSPVATMTGSGISQNIGAILAGCRMIVSKYADEIIVAHGSFRLMCWRLRIVRHEVIFKWCEVRLRLRESVAYQDLLLFFVLTVVRVVVKIALKPFFKHIYV